MSQWWICPWDNQVSIDDSSVMGIDCSAIPKNINLIWWYPSSREGEVLYNDRLAIREPFTDFRPLIRYFDAFIRAAITHPEHPITLAQAKFVKLKMLDALAATMGDDVEVHRKRISALNTVAQVAAYEIINAAGPE